MLFLGFFDLAEMLRGVTPRDVYVLAITEQEPLAPGSNLGTAASRLAVQVRDDSGDVLRYWTLPLGSINTRDGAPTDPKQWDHLVRISGSAIAAARDYLAAHGFRPVAASASMPAGITLIMADFTTVDFDQSTGRFSFK